MKKSSNELNSTHKSRIDLYKRSTFRRRNEKPQTALKTTMRVVKYLLEEKALIRLVVMLILISIVASLSGQKVYQLIIDDFIEKRVFDGFLMYILILAGLYLTEVITNFGSSYLMIGVSQRSLKRLRKTLFGKLQSLSVSFFDKNRDGDLMTRMTNDVDNISNTMTHTFISFITSVFTLILTITLMLTLNWKLTIVALVTIPLIYFAARAVSTYSRGRFRSMRYEIGALNGFVAEQINGAKVIQSFCQEEEIMKEFKIESRRVKNITVSAMTWASLMDPVINFLNNLRYIIIIFVGAYFNLTGDPLASIGTITVFGTLANRFGGQLNALANMYTDIQNALSGAERIFDILDDKSEIKNAPQAKDLDKVTGLVEMRNVSFGYVENTPVLKNVSITAKPGMKIGLVGHTGAGKTTIINLITRFYDIKEGEILIDGINIKDISKESLLSHVGIVLQDTNLFSESIFENVRYGKLDATLDEVVNACKLASCDHFINELKDKYDTILSRGGANISHGERQLLSIARTILKNPDILILDEATSSVDTITEKKLQEAINNLIKERTSFIIAHRLSTVRNVDLIIVMDHGQIIEQGTHEELLNQKGIYYSLINAKDENDLKDFDLVS